MDINSQLKGVNLGGWFSQIDAIEEKDPEHFPGIDEHIKTFITKEDIEYIKSSGYNHIRLPIDYQIFFDENGNILFKDRILYLEKMIKMILEKDLLIMLDLHECPGHDFDTGNRQIQRFFTEKEPVQATLKIWKQLAEIFSFDKRIYFEILNEPVAEDNLVWDRLKDQLTAEVRSFAPDQTLIIGSNRWSNVNSFRDFTPIINDDNIIYNCHFYNPLIFTHQFASWVHNPECHIKREYPGTYTPEGKIFGQVSEKDYGLWNRDRLKETLMPVLEWRAKYNLPVICNEFGVFHQAPRQSQLNYLKDIISILQEVGIGWTYWNYKNLDFGIISIGEQLHADLPQFQNPQKRDMELAEYLTGVV